MSLPRLDFNNPQQAFPPLETALTEPNGLLAIGGCLSTTRLINAYRQGIFPWFNEDDPLLWWSPNPRLVLLPTELKVSRRLAKTIRQQRFSFRIDTAFEKVIHACSSLRKHTEGTWINPEMIQAYQQLHHLGVAHSAEIWSEDQLVGGLYGVAIGQVFFGESMFHTRTDASKIAFVLMVKLLHSWHYQLIDCQVHTAHLIRFGATEVNRESFIKKLTHYCFLSPSAIAWTTP